MKTRSHNPLTCEAECPNCGTWQKVDRDEDGDPVMKIEPCTGCDLVHCAEHLTRYGTEELCIICLGLVIADAKAEGMERERAVRLYIQRENFILLAPSSITSDTVFPEDASMEDFSAAAIDVAVWLERQAKAYRDFAVEVTRL